MVRRWTCCLGAFFGVFFWGQFSLLAFRECIKCYCSLRFFRDSFIHHFQIQDLIPSRKFRFPRIWPGKTFLQKQWWQMRRHILCKFSKHVCYDLGWSVRMKVQVHENVMSSWWSQASILGTRRTHAIPGFAIYIHISILGGFKQHPKRGLKWWSQHQGMCSLPIQAASFSVVVDLAEIKTEESRTMINNVYCIKSFIYSWIC